MFGYFVVLRSYSRRNLCGILEKSRKPEKYRTNRKGSNHYYRGWNTGMLYHCYRNIILFDDHIKKNNILLLIIKIYYITANTFLFAYLLTGV